MKIPFFLINLLFIAQQVFSQSYFLNQEKGLPCNYYEGIYQSSDNFIWLVTASDGVVKYDGENFTQYTKKDGLLSNNCFGITEDKRNHLWIVNDTGITLFQNNHFYSFGAKNSFPNTSAYSIFCDSKNNIWIGTFDGDLLLFDGKKFYCEKSPFYQKQEIEFIAETNNHNRAVQF